MSEVSLKLKTLRESMQRHSLSGLIFRSVDWFSWITAGGNASVIMTNEIGVAHVLVTESGAWVLTSQVEDPRLREEEVPNELQLAVFPWQDAGAFARFINEKSKSGKIASDRPLAGEQPFPRDIQMLKRTLVPEEVARYRTLSKLAAEAMTAAMSRAEPTWTEFQLAAAGAQECLTRGLEPTLTLVAGRERGLRHRHPIPKHVPLGSMAMLVFCARGHGLYANFTRFVSFEKPSAQTNEAFEKLRRVESAAFAATKPGAPIRDVYQALKSGYASVGHADEINLHHQGGPCGYLSRDLIATPEVPADEIVLNQMAFAWNPSFPGAKVEDTVLCTESGIEILTVDPRWPSTVHDGRQRPDILVKA